MSEILTSPLSTAAPLPVPGTANFRAVCAPGGADDGAALRPGILYRSDALAALGSEGRQLLSELGVVRLVDLRTDEEAAAAPDDVAGTGIVVERVPVVAGSVREALALFASGAAPTLREVYTGMLQSNGDAFGQTLRLLADGGTTVIHCTAGKDRTGLAVALALLAVGATLDDVVADYARTEQNLAGPWADAMIARLTGHGLSVDDSLRELIVGSPAAALRDALEAVALVGGSPTAYLDGIGVDASVRERLRAVLLTPPPAA